MCDSRPTCLQPSLGPREEIPRAEDEQGGRPSAFLLRCSQAGLPLPAHGTCQERARSQDTWVLSLIHHCLCPLGQLPHSLSPTFLICKTAPTSCIVEDKMRSEQGYLPVGSALESPPPPAGHRGDPRPTLRPQGGPLLPGKRGGEAAAHPPRTRPARWDRSVRRKQDIRTAGQQDCARPRPGSGGDPRRTPATWRRRPDSPRRLPRRPGPRSGPRPHLPRVPGHSVIFLQRRDHSTALGLNRFTTCHGGAGWWDCPQYGQGRVPISN